MMLSTSEVYQIDSRGCRFVGSVPFEQWEHVGQTLGSLCRGSQWMIGDWLNFGEASYGEKYSQAIEVTGLDVKTITNYAWVARNVPYDERNDRLSFTHHAELAAMSFEERKRWIELSISNEWSVNELRNHLRGQQSKSSGGGSGGGEGKSKLQKAQEAYLSLCMEDRSDFMEWVEGVNENAHA